MSAALDIPCVILAGGQSRRMGGGDKFLKKIAGKTLLDHIIARIEPQVGAILINSNVALGHMPYPVQADVVGGNQGPLAGILTGLDYYNAQGCTATHMLCIPSDAPFIPVDLVARLQAGLSSDSCSISMAYSRGRVHPVISLWPLSLAKDLRAALVEEELRKIIIFAQRYELSNVRWSDDEGDPFYNINKPEDFEAAAARASEMTD